MKHPESDPRTIDGRKKINSPKYLEQEILLPAKGGYVFLSLIAALILNLLPLQDIVLLLRPDFVAITLLYWGINQPQRMSMSQAFCIGLLMDVGNTTLLGQHALAYCIIVYFAAVFHRRLRIFNLLQQAPQVGFILFVMQMIIFLIGLLSGSFFPGWYFFLASGTGALLWAPISFLLTRPLRLKSDPNAL
ncbi:rod shape-determining protein MreD [Nitrosomonas cryotolerans]|uniref:Rod shape-determining protein MreD n=1 Tax=Nitrosomonas cryotolerans ATCC 49181 TaxID=1131553 RepID=A0A1N6JH44_9PROT|nr:rod shape-determining protein MreD [Nitrosomonas cryotolerans]SFP67635.1 rod shape-determining protein MreD [Nitrosomonas cryotolerans]SIO43529.1 rod shape-determining protein MreD [Nitrosomonas cryotolerans ATCC 49181]